MNLFRTAMLFTTLLAVGLCISRVKTNEMSRIILSRLLNTTQYNKEILPVESSYAGPVRVQFSIFLRHLDVDEKNMKMTTDMTFRMKWNDPRLKYANSQDVKHITFTDFSKLWIPDPFFKNSYDTNMLGTVHPEAYVRINHSGDVLFSARYLVKTHCPMDLSRFPHDRQTCPLIMASYGYDVDSVVYDHPNEDDIKISKNPHSSQFEFESMDIMECSSTTSTGRYSCIQLLVKINRKMSIYITGWYVPCMMFVIISFFSHLVSAQKLLPRVILCLGPLLTLATSSFAIRQNVAVVGYITALDVYSGVACLTIFMSLLQTCTSYYYLTIEKVDQNSEGKLEGEQPKDLNVTKMDRVKEFLRTKGDTTSRISIISFYFIFIFLYMLAYST